MCAATAEAGQASPSVTGNDAAAPIDEAAHDGSSGGRARWTDIARSAHPDDAEDKQDGKASEDNTKSGCTTNNPVVLTSGEKLLAESDFLGAGLYGLSLTRHYRSLYGSFGMFGPKWRSSLAGWQISWSGSSCSPEPGGYCTPLTATLTEADGTRYRYTSSTGLPGAILYTVGGTVPAAATGTLVYNPGTATWLLTRATRTYSFNSGGKLTTVKNAGGTTLLTYAWGSYGPTSVANAAGKSVLLTWSTNGVVTQAKDTAGRTWNYGYNANGMLTSVTSPGSPADTRSYHYEHAADPTLLTGVSIGEQQLRGQRGADLPRRQWLRRPHR